MHRPPRSHTRIFVRYSSASWITLTPGFCSVAYSHRIVLVSAGVYLHIPFCKSRCSYCDFATDVYRDSGAVDRYVDALVKEISSFGQQGIEADTIYFCGGTPSLLSAEQVRRLLDAVRGDD